MQPLTAQTYEGGTVVGWPISDPLPPLTLALAYDKSKPRKLVQHFVDACHTHFSVQGPDQCIVSK